MSSKIRTLIYGEHAECVDAAELMLSIPWISNSELECRHVSNYDDLQHALQVWRPCLTVVLANGAAGMEGVFAVRDNHPTSAVFWFSDDHDFGMMSHRLECAYFAVKPMTQDKVKRAFHRCAHVGVCF